MTDTVDWTDSAWWLVTFVYPSRRKALGSGGRQREGGRSGAGARGETASGELAESPTSLNTRDPRGV